MRKLAAYIFAALLIVPATSVALGQSRAIKPYQTPPLGTPTPLGFGTVLCVADGVAGASLPGIITVGQATITSTSGVSSPSAGLSAITVNISNGTLTSADYIITFVDNDSSDTLNCGDTIVSIVPAP